MDRSELRFRILFEYYNRLYSGADYDPHAKIMEINADYNEKQAAKVWLIDALLVEGEVRIAAMGDYHPIIGRINSRGCDIVESVMDSTFTEIKSKDGGFDSLSKTDKIKRFAADCLGSPAAGPLCEATYEAITALMG